MKKKAYENREGRRISTAARSGDERNQYVARGFMDNRPETTQTKEIQLLANNSLQSKQLARVQSMTKKQTIKRENQKSPAQRAVIIGEDKDNLVFAGTFPKVVLQAGEPVTDIDSANLKGQTKIGILGHGSINSITLSGKALNGDALAVLLVDKGIEDNSEVFIWSCSAGLRGKNDTEESSSLVEQTTEKLGKLEKKDILVKGFRGTHFSVAADGSGRIINPEITKGDKSVADAISTNIQLLNIHHAIKANYFSDPYIETYMALQIKTIEGKEITICDPKTWRNHRRDLTMDDFMAKEKFAHDNLSVAHPTWLGKKELFEAEKNQRWIQAGNALITDEYFKTVTLSDLNPEDLKKMILESKS